MGPDIMPKIREQLPGSRIQTALNEMTRFVLDRFDFTGGQIGIVGIQTRGAVLAKRLVQELRKQKGNEVHYGAVDITLYRDDFSSSGITPIVGETHLDFDIDNKHLVLVDDVLFTGRTVRAALDEIMDFGRPRSITLAVLVDRGHRELPIAADFVGINLETKRAETVVLHVGEQDGKEEILICESRE